MYGIKPSSGQGSGTGKVSSSVVGSSTIPSSTPVSSSIGTSKRLYSSVVSSGSGKTPSEANKGDGCVVR